VTAAVATVRAVPLLCLCLTGCTGLFKSTAAPEQTYFLRAPVAASSGAPVSSSAPANSGAPAESGAGAAASAATSLRINRPIAAPGLDTPHIMLLQPDHRMNFFTGSRWPAPAPDVIEALAAQTLRASGAWSSVEYGASPFPSEYLLQLTVRRFEADYSEGGPAPVVYVVFDSVLGRREGREVIATFTVSGSAPAADNRLKDVVAAFEQATGAALTTLSQKAAQAVQSDTQRATQNDANPLPSSSR
jgi:cholesterol transport system auxiliary component